MTERSLYPNNVEVRQRDLANTESTKSSQLRERLIDLASGSPGGRAGGLELQQDPSDTTTVRVTAGRGYTPNGEQVEVLTTASASQIELADYTEGVDNFIYALYTEAETLPAPQEFGGASRVTRAVGVTTVQAFTAATFNALPDSHTDITLFAKDRALLLGRVVGPNAAGNSSSTINPSDIFPVKSPTDQVQRRFLNVNSTAYTPGVNVVEVLDPETHPAGKPGTGPAGRIRIETSATDPTTRTTTLEYESPGFGDSFGTPVDVTSGGTYVIESTLGERIRVQVNSAFLPQQNYTETNSVLISEALTDDLGTDAVLRNSLYPEATVRPTNRGRVSEFDHILVNPDSVVDDSPESPWIAFDNVNNARYSLLMSTLSGSGGESRIYYGPSEETPTIPGLWLVQNAFYNNEYDVWTLDDLSNNAAQVALRNGQVRVDFQSTSGFADTAWNRALTAGVAGASSEVIVGGSASTTAGTDVATVALTSSNSTGVRSDGNVTIFADSQVSVQSNGDIDIFAVSQTAVQSNGDIIIDAASQIDIDAGAGGVDMDTTGPISITAASGLFGTILLNASGAFQVDASDVTLDASGAISLDGNAGGVKFGAANVGFADVYEVRVTASWSASAVNTAVAVETVTSEVPAGAPSFTVNNGVVLGYRDLTVTPGTDPAGGSYTSSVLITGTNQLSVVLHALDSSESFDAGTWEGEVLIGVMTT